MQGICPKYKQAFNLFIEEELQIKMTSSPKTPFEIEEESTRNIPAKIARQVRQECGFGCAICGMPFFQYEHITDWAIVNEHKAENILLLCPNHHSSKTTKKLSIDRLKEAKEDPINTKKSLSKTPHSIVDSRCIGVKLGTNKALFAFPSGNGSHPIIRVKGQDLFIIHCEDNWLTFSMNLTDSKGNTLIEIDKSFMKVSTELWDYTYEADKVIVKSGLRGILLEMHLKNDLVEIITANFLDKEGNGFTISDGKIHVNKNWKISSIFVDCIEDSITSGGWRLFKDPEVDKTMHFAYDLG